MSVGGLIKHIKHNNKRLLELYFHQYEWQTDFNNVIKILCFRGKEQFGMNVCLGGAPKEGDSCRLMATVTLRKQQASLLPS